MYSAAMSPPRWPVPRPSSKSLARNFTCARIFSGSTDAIACSAEEGSAVTLGTGIEETPLPEPEGLASCAKREPAVMRRIKRSEMNLGIEAS